MATLEKGIAFSVKPGGLVRGTYDGTYTVIRPYRPYTDQRVTDLLRAEFARGNCLPIPADAATNGFPELVETRLK